MHRLRGSRPNQTLERHLRSHRPFRTRRDFFKAGRRSVCPGSARASRAGWKTRPCAFTLHYRGNSPRRTFPWAAPAANGGRALLSVRQTVAHRGVKTAVEMLG